MADRRRTRRSPAALIALITVAAQTTLAQENAALVVRGAVLGERSSLIIEGDRKLRGSVTVTGAVAEVRLSRPLSGVPLVTRSALRESVEDIDLTAEGLRVRARPGFTMVEREVAGAAVVVDFIPRRKAAASRPPPRKAPIPKRRDPAPALRVATPPEAVPPVLRIEPAAGVAEIVAAAAALVRVPLPAAVFEREGILWIAVAGKQAPSPSGAIPAGARLLEPARGAAGVALRLEIPGLAPLVRKVDGMLTVTLQAGPGSAPTARPEAAHPHADADLTLHDPDVGDEIEVFLAEDSQSPAPWAWSANDVEVLPSWLGSAVRRLAAEPVPAAIEIASRTTATPAAHGAGTPAMGGHDAADAMPTSAADHAVAAAPPPVTASTEVAPPSHDPADRAESPLGLIELAGLGPAERRARRHAALARVAADPEATAARLDLARLYLADGLGAEAEATLAGDAPAARSMRMPAAVAAALQQRWAKASALLADAGDDREVSLWRSFVAASEVRPDACRDTWARSDRVLWLYPRPLRLRLGPMIARCILETGRVDAVLAILDRLEPSIRGPQDRARAEHVRGLALARDGQWKAAREALGVAAAIGDDATRTAATFDAVATARDAGRLTAEQATDALSAQTAGWRGHRDEPLMLDRLAREARGARRWPLALATWRAALDRAPGAPALAGVLPMMRDTLAEALADAAAGRGPALAALALTLSWTELLDTEDARTRAVTVADKAADGGLARAALDLAATLPLTTAELAGKRTHWQALADGTGPAADTGTPPEAKPLAGVGALQALTGDAGMVHAGLDAPLRELRDALRSLAQP